MQEAWFKAQPCPHWARPRGDLSGPLLRPQTRGTTAAAQGCSGRVKNKGAEEGATGRLCSPYSDFRSLAAASWNFPQRRLLPSSGPLPDLLTVPFFSLFPPPVPPTIEQGSEGTGTLLHRSGELVSMACPVRGSPPIHVSWLKDGLPLPLSQRTHLHGSGRILR